MRRPVRPFTVEHKRGARPAGGNETPFLEPQTPAPTPMPEPPRQWAPEPTRWAAAEALFSIPPADTPQPAIAEPANLRRILPSLNEPVAPAYEFEDAPKRRGRKPGSRNKTSRALREGNDPKSPNTVSRNAFELWAQDEETEDAAETHDTMTEQLPPATAPEAYAVAISAPQLALIRRGRLVRADLPRGLRWQARLPRFAR